MIPFISKYTAPSEVANDSLWFILKEHDILLIQKSNQWHLPNYEDLANIENLLLNKYYLGSLRGIDCFAADINEKMITLPFLQFKSLRQAYHDISEELFTISAKAKQIICWDKLFQYCTQCGKPLIISTKERAKVCQDCQQIFYPTISPAVIMLIYKGNEMLLARSAHFTSAMYSTLAGFIEPGESAEEAVAREVFEEVGIHIHKIQYFASQPWPFPNSLMLGFYAEYHSGELKIDSNEIEDAKWFSFNNLPTLPSPASIARKLIDSFLDNMENKLI